MPFIRKLLASEELRKMLKFGVTGGLNTLVDFCVFALLTKLVGWNEGLARAIAYLAGMVNSYFLNRSWTFRSKDRVFSAQLVRFAVANLVVLLLSVLLIELLVCWGLGVLVAKLLVTAVTMVINFVLSRLWVFR